MRCKMALPLSTEMISPTEYRTSEIAKVIGPIAATMTGTTAGTTATLQTSPDKGTTWQNTGAEDTLTETESQKVFFTSAGYYYRFIITGTNRATVKLWWADHSVSSYYNLPNRSE